MTVFNENDLSETSGVGPAVISISGKSSRRLTSERVYLRPPARTDQNAWLTLRILSSDHLQPFEPAWGPDATRPVGYRRLCTRLNEELDAGNAFPYFIFLVDGDVLIGGMTLSNVRRSVVQSASLGYWIGTPFINQGYMTEAMQTAVRHAFLYEGLNRLEAACLAQNLASRRVLEKCGFQEEGIGRGMLKINGTWQDHMRYGVLADDPWPRVPLVGPQPGHDLNVR